MSIADDVWRRKSDEELEAAGGAIHEYTEEGRKAILAEISRRSLDVVVSKEGTEVEERGDIEGVESADPDRGEQWSQPTRSTSLSRVSVVDINMPFWSMVIFMVKWAIASIPAFIVLFVILVVVGATVAAAFGGVLAALVGLSR